MIEFLDALHARAVGDGGDAAKSSAPTFADIGFAGGHVISGAMSIGAGFSRASDYKVAAAQEELAGERELRAGAQRVEAANAEFADVVAAQEVIFLANGVETGVGTPAAVRSASARRLDRAVGIIRSNAEASASARRFSARRLRSKARSAQLSGILEGVSSFAQAALTFA